MAVQPDGTGGDEIRLNGKQAVVVGYFELGTGFSWNGMLMSSEETFNRFLMTSESQVNFGLVQLKPGADAAPGAARTPRRPAATTCRSSPAPRSTRWKAATGCGVTSVGQFLLVAVDPRGGGGHHLRLPDDGRGHPHHASRICHGEGPRLSPALPHRRGALAGRSLAIIGYVPGFLAAIGLYAAARKWGGIPTGMTLGIAIGVLMLTCGMCLASGLLAMRKVHTADPADLF